MGILWGDLFRRYEERKKKKKEKTKNIKISGLPKLLRWSHALRSDQLQKIVAYLSCSTGRTHFAQTNFSVLPSKLIYRLKVKVTHSFLAASFITTRWSVEMFLTVHKSEPLQFNTGNGVC